MWTIRREQIDALQGGVEKRYCEELRRLLRERFPQLVARLNDQELLIRISAGVQRARAYGIRTGEGILAYVGLSIAAGPGFHADPKISRFLEYPGDDPDRKIEWLFKRVVEKLQNIMKKSNDAAKPRD